jgi:hypothetical protein
LSTGTSVAVSEATRLSEIKFPEFTTKLVTDVFDALISANIRQTQAYTELLQAVSKSLTEYIDDTKDDINGEMILQFLTKVLPDPSKVKVGSTLTTDDATKLNDAVKIPGVVESPGITAAPISNQSALDAILGAIAKRIAADKYTLLKDMVKMGVLRLVVENGTIETRLTFTTYGSTFMESTKNNYNSSAFSVRASAGTGKLTSLWVNASASTSFTAMHVSTAKETNRDISGSQVQIYGRVVINFKTDYQSLGP